MTKNPKDLRLTIRLMPEERLALEAKAGDRPLAAFVREKALGDAGARHSRTRRPTQETRHLAQILALLGQTGAVAGLHAIGQAAQDGVIDLEDTTLGQVEAAVEDLREIKRLLIRALRVAER